MKKLLLIIFFILPMLALHAQDETALIRAVKARIDKVNTYQANGTMTIDAAFIKAPPSTITAFYK